eukprot:9096321-Karenia_brevis.AAC.1
MLTAHSAAGLLLSSRKAAKAVKDGDVNIKLAEAARMMRSAEDLARSCVAMFTVKHPVNNGG